MNPDVIAEITHTHRNGFGEPTDYRDGFTIPIVAWDALGEAMVPGDAYGLVRLLDYVEELANSDIWDDEDDVKAKILYPTKRIGPDF